MPHPFLTNPMKSSLTVLSCLALSLGGLKATTEPADSTPLMATPDQSSAEQAPLKVPEPATALFGSLGLLMLLRRRNKH